MQLKKKKVEPWMQGVLTLLCAVLGGHEYAVRQGTDLAKI